MFKKTFFIFLVIIIFVMSHKTQIENFGAKSVSFTDLTKDFSWAKEPAEELASLGAISGISEGIFAPELLVTKEQVAKMLSIALDIKEKNAPEVIFKDVDASRWSYGVICQTYSFFPNTDGSAEVFSPEKAVSREYLAATLACAFSLPKAESDILSECLDAGEINESTKELLAASVSAKVLSISDGYLYPSKNVTRAEAVVMLKRAMSYDAKPIIKPENTKILGKAEVSLNQAKKWAKSKDASDIFLEIADIYWEYGEKTGLRPDLLYAQAAKETNFGKYTGNVLPEQNNWAGIKTVMAEGDNSYDHETFASSEDGVRGHFNHMCAYVGLAPLGEPHARFLQTKTASWAGTIVYAEELGGKWAPDENYGKSIVSDFLEPMKNYKE